MLHTVSLLSVFWAAHAGSDSASSPERQRPTGTQLPRAAPGGSRQRAGAAAGRGTTGQRGHGGDVDDQVVLIDTDDGADDGLAAG